MTPIAFALGQAFQSDGASRRAVRLENLAFLALRLGVIMAVMLLRTAKGETLCDRQAATEREYAGQLEELARWCEKRQLPEQAANTRAWIAPQPPLTLVVALPDQAWSDVQQAADGPATEWGARFRQLRQGQGKRLYELATEAAGERQFAVAFQLAHATLREDPDHEAARRLLGYKRQDGKWLTQYEWNKAQASQVWHAQYGWLPRKHVARYEAGERFYKGRWISAADDARLHADIDRGWETITEHYQVRTNHSLEESARLAARLEEFYGVWRQVFVRCYSTDDQLARLFREGAPPYRKPRPHQVVCFRDRDEYNAALAAEHPNLGVATGGYYSGVARRAYFFAGPEQEDANVCHEATHQLFQELRSLKESGREANFWVVEGIACFMESYQRQHGLVLLGGVDAYRLQNARTRLLRDGFHLGLAELCSLDKAALQRHDQIKQVYSEASGMTYFLMYAEGGRYRQALVDYLATVYANRDRPETLSELTGVSYGKLDEQYQHFIRNLP